MPRPTEREIVLVSAYLRTGSTAAAACDLGIRPETYRHRLGRVYRRHDVSCMAQLVFVLAEDLRPHVETGADAPLVEGPVPARRSTP